MNACNIKGNAAPPGLHSYSFHAVFGPPTIPCRKEWLGAARPCRLPPWPDSALRFFLALLALAGPLAASNVGAESAQLASEEFRSQEVVKSIGNPSSKEMTGQVLEKRAPTQAAAKRAASSRAVEPGPAHQVSGIQHTTRHSDGQRSLNAQDKSARPSLPLPAIHTPDVNPNEGLPTRTLKPPPSQVPQAVARKTLTPAADAFHSRNTAPTGIGGPSGTAKSREILTGLNGTEIKRKP
jgi:hypothetical protein